MKVKKQILLKDIFRLHFYKQDLMSIYLPLVETYKILCGFSQVKNLHITLQEMCRGFLFSWEMWYHKSVLPGTGAG